MMTLYTNLKQELIAGNGNLQIEDANGDLLVVTRGRISIADLERTQKEAAQNGSKWSVWSVRELHFLNRFGPSQTARLLGEQSNDVLDDGPQNTHILSTVREVVSSLITNDYNKTSGLFLNRNTIKGKWDCINKIYTDAGGRGVTPEREQTADEPWRLKLFAGQTLELLHESLPARYKTVTLVGPDPVDEETRQRYGFISDFKQAFGENMRGVAAYGSSVTTPVGKIVDAYNLYVLVNDLEKGFQQAANIPLTYRGIKVKLELIPYDQSPQFILGQLSPWHRIKVLDGTFPVPTPDESTIKELGWIHAAEALANHKRDLPTLFNETDPGFSHRVRKNRELRTALMIDPMMHALRADLYPYEQGSPPLKAHMDALIRHFGFSDNAQMSMNLKALQNMVATSSAYHAVMNGALSRTESELFKSRAMRF